MVGETWAKRENIHSGDIIRLSTPFGQEEVTVRGIFNSGDSAEEQIFAPMAMVQTLADKKGYLTSIEVSALTTPDNELAVKAAKDPSSLSSMSCGTVRLMSVRFVIRFRMLSLILLLHRCGR